MPFCNDTSKRLNTINWSFAARYVLSKREHRQERGIKATHQGQSTLPAARQPREARDMSRSNHSMISIKKRQEKKSGDLFYQLSLRS
ncbi:hypothetical protein J6590_089606 [Homalodisca vitripennis]|nr:hypothetical protein J6590_089606 [Homalodisca vitripennis]